MGHVRALAGGLLGLLLAGLCVWRGEIPEVDAAGHLLDALKAREAWAAWDPGTLGRLAVGMVPNPSFPALLQGLAMRVLGTETWVGLLALWPWWTALITGLFLGGRALGGRQGGILAVLLGVASPAVLSLGSRLMLDLPLSGAMALAAGGLLANQGEAGWGLVLALPTKLGAGPGLGGMALEGALRFARTDRKKLTLFLVPPGIASLLLLPWSLGEVLQYAGGNANIPPAYVGLGATGARLAAHLGSLPALVGPVLGLGVVLALLGRAAPQVLRIGLWMAFYVLGTSVLTHSPQPRYLLPLLPLLSMASAGVFALPWKGRERAAAALLALLALAHTGLAFSDRQTLMPPYQRLSRMDELAGLDALIDRLELQRGIAPRLRVSTRLPAGGVLSLPALLARAQQRAVPLDFLDAAEGREADFSLSFFRGPPATAGAWQVQVGEYLAVGGASP